LHVYDNEKLKITVVLIAAVMAFGGCMSISMADSANAESEAPEVEEITVKMDGEDVVAYDYLGIIYTVTSDAEGAQEVGVYGTSSGSTVSGHYVCVNSLTIGEDDDEVTYSVTSVLPGFKDHAAGVTGSNLVLAASITSYEEGCFSGLGLTGIVVGDVSDEMMSKAGLSSGDYTVLDDSLAADYTMNVSAGDVNGNVIANYNGGESSAELRFYSKITLAAACPFENPGYDFAGFTDSDDNEIGDGAQAFVIGTTLYLDGEAYEGASSVTAEWEENKDFLAEYEIEIALPFLSICTITGTYEMWMMYATVFIILLLAVIGLSMFGYRTMMARKG